jgi:hypothetical protein
MRRYAQSLLRQYDANQDGRLQQDEWSQMRGNPQESDANGDGILTEEELAARLAAWGRGQGGDGGGDGTGTGDAADGPRRSYRFRTAAERLPQGLPGWFARSDADGDGQVAMAEYSRSWTINKANEFTRLDANSDGVITPQEALDSGG